MAQNSAASSRPLPSLLLLGRGPIIRASLLDG
jgi:hypothetical protein